MLDDDFFGHISGLPRTWYISEHKEYREKIDLLRKMSARYNFREIAPMLSSIFSVLFRFKVFLKYRRVVKRIYRHIGDFNQDRLSISRWQFQRQNQQLSK